MPSDWVEYTLTLLTSSGLGDVVSFSEGSGRFKTSTADAGRSLTSITVAARRR